jgi:hypothetical protein
MAATIQRDRFAFTEAETRTLGAPVPAKVLAAPPPTSIAEPVYVGDETPVLRIEAIEVRAKPARGPRPQQLQPSPSVEPPKIPCRPSWRELASGPAGRMVREICDPRSLNGVPQA